MNTSQLLPTLLLTIGALFIYMSYWYLVAIFLKRVDVVDIAWGMGFAVVAMVVLYFNKQYFAAPYILTLLIIIWGLRLSFHIYSKNINKNNDPRYEKLVKKWRNKRSAIFVKIFMFQGFLILVISLPVIITNVFGTNKLGFNNIIGVCIWLLGFYFEVVGDYQLKRFLKNPYNKGKIMSKGLWKYTRHPNYFGEVVMWWGIFVFVLNQPYVWVSLISPVVITFLILKVSGIPMAEKQMKNSKDYTKYKKVTSAFIPLPPKH